MHQGLSSSVPPSFPLHPLGLERTCYCSQSHFRYLANLCRKDGRTPTEHSLGKQALTWSIGLGSVLELGQAFVVLNPLWVLNSKRKWDTLEVACLCANKASEFSLHLYGTNEKEINVVVQQESIRAYQLQHGSAAHPDHIGGRMEELHPNSEPAFFWQDSCIVHPLNQTPTAN